jgi:hypothetical protein
VNNRDAVSVAEGATMSDAVGVARSLDMCVAIRSDVATLPRLDPSNTKEEREPTCLM